jgi:lysophospholipase L1-like esterase
MAAGYTTVSGTNLTDASGNKISNATISFQPCNSQGVPLSFQVGGSGQAIQSPISAQVTNGAFSVALADTSLTQPQNISYKVTVTDNASGNSLLGPGYLIQPSGTVWSFDNFVPNLPALPVVMTVRSPNNRGNWAANTVYSPLDYFFYQNSSYVVNTGYQSGASFGAIDTANTSIWAAGGTLSGTLSAPLVAPQGATVTGGLTADALTLAQRKQSTLAGVPQRLGWYNAVLDSAKKILSGIDLAGVQHFFSSLTFHAIATFKKSVTVVGNATFGSVTYGGANRSSSFLHSGWINAVLDNANKILYGLHSKTGFNFFTKAVFNKDAYFQGAVNISGDLGLTEVTLGDQPAKQLSGFGRSGWISAVVDSSRKILMGLKSDNTLWVGGQQVAVVSSTSGVQNTFVDAANYSAWTASDSSSHLQVISRDKAGTGGTKQVTSAGSNNFNPRFTSDGTKIIFNTDRSLYPPLVRGLMYVPAAGGTEFPAFPIQPGTAVCWGDSLTQGGEDGSGVTYETALASLLSITLANKGIGGQTSTMIAARQGGYVPQLTVSGNAIPAAPGSVQVTAIDGNNIHAWSQSYCMFLSSGAENYTHRATGWLAGIHGTLSRTATGGPPSTSETYTFTPDAGTTGAACPPNTPWIADPQGTDEQWQFIWVGRNDIKLGTAAEIQTVQNNITAMISFCKPLYKKICLLAITNKRDGTENSGSTNWTAITGLNTWMRQTYPQYFVVDAQGRDVRQRLVASYNPNNSQDVTDFGNDVPPSSLMFDVTHPNQYGFAIVAQILSEFITARNLLNS